MKYSNWPSGTASVIVLPTGVDGEELLSLANEWSANWLLSAAFWVEDHQIPEISDGPPEVKAWVLGRDEQGQSARVEVDLFWALGSQQFSLVRLLAVRAEQSKTEMEATKRKIRLLDRYMDESKPHKVDASNKNEVGTALRKINLVFAPTEASQKISRDVVEITWDANIIASAEDRPNPGSFDAFVSRGPRYYGFVLAHIATAGGLWTGLPKSTYELGDSFPNRSVARLQRVFVRAVATDRLAGELAQWAIDKSSSSDIANSLGQISGQEIATIHSDSVSTKLTELVNLLMAGTENDSFQYRGLSQDRWAQEPPRKLLQKIKIRLADIVEALIYLPKWSKEMLNRKLDPDDLESRAWGYLPERLDPRFKTQSLDDVLNKPRQKPSLVKPELWKFVRETVSSAIDSPVNIKTPTPLQGDKGKRLVFGDTSKIFPDPANSWSGEEFEEAAGLDLIDLNWLDVPGTKSQFVAIDELKTQLEPGMIEARLETEQTQAELHEAQIAEHTALIELQRAEFELEEDLKFANSMRSDHTHGLPERLVGAPRPVITDTTQRRGEQAGEASNISPDRNQNSNAAQEVNDVN